MSEVSSSGLRDIFDVRGLASIESRTKVVLPPMGKVVLHDVSPRLVEPDGSLDDAVRFNARISYAELLKGNRQRRPVEDAQLIDYLIAHRHTSPLERVQFTFNMHLPIFVARQVIRHRTARLNEQSGRYTEFAEDAFFIPSADSVTPQSKSNKQMREEDSPAIEAASWFVAAMEEHSKSSFKLYSEALDREVPRELARCVLPVNTYTCWQWTIDLNNLLKFIQLRSDAHAQRETRVYSDCMQEFVRVLAPDVYASWVNHVRDAVNISASDFEFMFGSAGLRDYEIICFENVLDARYRALDVMGDKLPKRRRERLRQLIDRVSSLLAREGRCYERQR